ncbi:monosaccharide-transporting ATPase [Caldicellulosiruptor hydrothermalis 108]|uniref:Monosaccharide-transporting ATPase n=1 Tax=Caldicellulosiruptor hydrothermalis (strain DSM 18901 / VKM B-2411 / 108) TaxID=632292 RepID=E4Q9Y8_CALH1|nr:substrate-binding domain-containing protein [Caldicellulosiruptor hydrothermalis]ADQ05863.1 monosaccharide-transporting ATPase [Caldicellulosiruptor hydrothermalis 108]
MNHIYRSKKVVKKSRMKKVFFIFTLILFATAVTIFIVYWPNISKNEQQVLKPSKVRIGFAMGTLKEERWFKDRDILIAKAHERGYEVEWVNANENDVEQINQVKYLLSKNINILIIVPNNYEKCSSAINLAKKRGIKVISYDRLVKNSDIDVYVSFNNYKVGELMAKWLLKTVPRGNYVFLLGDPGDYNVQMIKEGYHKVLDSFIQKKQINNILEKYCYNWRKEYAYNYVNNLLEEGKRIDAVLASNDSLAEGAIMALSEKRLAGSVPVTGQDADISACQRIVKGTQLMTVYKPIDKLVDLTLDIVDKLIKNKPLKPTSMLNNGYKNVPTFFIDPIGVDKSNINDTVIKDNFHTWDEVYITK